MNDDAPTSLSLELQRLVQLYGYGTVESALQGLSSTASESRPAGPRRRAPRGPSARTKSLLEQNPPVAQLMSLYDAKVFLPTLRDIHAFLSAHGVKARAKSRLVAFPKVATVLASKPADELLHIRNSLISHGDTAAYDLLADAIMAKRPL